MDIFEDLTRAVDQATESAMRTGKAAQTRAQIANLRRQRDRSMATLGKALYPTVRKDEKLRAGNEHTIRSIEQIDESIERLEEQLRDINATATSRRTASAQGASAQGAARQAAAQGTSAQGAARRGAAQGTSAQGAADYYASAQTGQAQEASGPRCHHCGDPLMPGALYCSTCGARVANA